MQRKMKMLGLIVAASVLSTSVWAGRSSGGQAPQNQFQNQPQQNQQQNAGQQNRINSGVNLNQMHAVPGMLMQQNLSKMTPAQRQIYYHQQLSQLHSALGFSPQQAQTALGQHNQMISVPGAMQNMQGIIASQAHLAQVQAALNSAQAAAKADGRITPQEQQMINVLRQTQADHNALLAQREQQMAMNGNGF
jgi:hypothetical protein